MVDFIFEYIDLFQLSFELFLSVYVENKNIDFKLLWLSQYISFIALYKISDQSFSWFKS